MTPLRQPRCIMGSLLLGIAIALNTIACSHQSEKIVTLPATEEANPAVKTSESLQGKPVKFGVLVIDSAVSVNERYSALLNYLSEKTGQPFELVSLTQESQFTLVESEELDFTTNNPLAAAQIRRLYNTKFLVTHSRPKTGPEFSALIIAKSDSGIKTLADLKGKKVACVNFETAAAGCVFQIQHLLNKGIDPFVEFGSFEENKSQDNIVLAVLNGTLDAGFIRTGQLEKMFAKGLINDLDAIAVIDRAKDDFFYPHTTARYPEWPIAALSNTDPTLVKQVQTALLNIPSNHQALTDAKLDGFVPAADYSSLDALIENLRLKSWDAR